VFDADAMADAVVLAMKSAVAPLQATQAALQAQIGTLEAGKRADIILIDGNPTLNVYEMLKTKIVLKDGKVVVDKR